MFYVLRDSFASALHGRAPKVPPNSMHSNSIPSSFVCSAFRSRSGLPEYKKTLHDFLRVNACKQAFIPHEAQPARVPSTGFRNPPRLQHTTILHCDLISAIAFHSDVGHGTNNCNSLISAILITLDPCPELEHRWAPDGCVLRAVAVPLGLYHSHRSASKAPQGRHARSSLAPSPSSVPNYQGRNRYSFSHLPIVRNTRSESESISLT